MNIHNMPFDLSYKYDDNLREVPNAPHDLAAAVQFLEESVRDEPDLYERMKMLGRLGVYCRILNRLDSAERYINAAIAAANAMNDRVSRLTNLIRLAHVYQWQWQFALADRLLEQSIAVCENATDALQSYVDMAYHHLGKSKFDQQDYAAAAQLFQKALDARESKGNLELIHASRYALELTLKRLAYSG